MTSSPDVAAPWLALIGIGEDGAPSLIPAAREKLAQASFVIGGARHLKLAGPLKAQTMAWPSPIEAALPEILSRRGQRICVLASGDPFFYGVGALLSAHVPRGEMICLPAPSSFSLAAARLAWSLQDCALLSLHGRDFERIIPALQPGAKILCLSWDGSTPAKIAALLRERGLGRSMIHVLEALGGPREKIRAVEADQFDLVDIDPLNLVAVELTSEPRENFIPISNGLDDSLFEHDGQLTKREIRAASLSALAPRRGDLLWDVGSGSGSVAIEWLRLDPANRAIAIEAHAERAARIGRNAKTLGAPQIKIVEGKAPAAFDGLPRPHAIFVGGGSSDPNLLDEAFAALEPGGRFVVNAVTLEAEAELLARFQAMGGELTRLSVTRAEKLGGFFGWRPSMPITQWAITKVEGMAT
ncbi:precorrin-6y C5,15-methyltransferase (decarboxylating), CbiE subunit [Methylocella silvestris BL2]|uniref:Precorrin-6y C5,15-methyltransferase (Decarboxylating), CbiE subunit n=1 Tax=Methylocella silvestris (strain DSM 15510 / CIP 108128 / LMG 27833 / NCIMB 13906 / BL2) TaxID=395965 RepID=B8EQF6_METSB|nr:bifunctional cobalt-precorrin-7 (C(5))-methyltransferase/cobalt-precorrin-6B (C(15))-methyltransferase [Methylocella silvestris]ACK52169.1 precorrin-6y C5,15-methyltransferase (decarboxylating), CbiE subunit [Methylocella silvestris BL2]